MPTPIQTFNNTVRAIEGFYPETFSEKVISVFCDCCSNRADGTPEQLQASGWTFGNGAEFCPEHRY